MSYYILINTERGLNGTFSIAPNADAQSLDLPKKKILKLSYAQMLASVIAIITQVKEKMTYFDFCPVNYMLN